MPSNASNFFHLLHPVSFNPSELPETLDNCRSPSIPSSLVPWQIIFVASDPAVDQPQPNHQNANLTDLAKYAIFFPELSQDCIAHKGYLWIACLGSGSEGEVHLVWSVTDGQLYARKRQSPYLLWERISTSEKFTTTESIRASPS